jgi:hypothetical protein
MGRSEVIRDGEPDRPGAQATAEPDCGYHDLGRDLDQESASILAHA